MKRIPLLILALCLFGVGQVFAQSDTTITLDDATPAIDVSITLPPDATGVVVLDLSMAGVKLTDAGGNLVFTSADARVHMLELSIAPNTGNHTLTVERLPGAQQASVRVHSQAELTPTSPTTSVESNRISSQQEHTLSLTSGTMGGQVAVEIPQNASGLITANFPSAQVASLVTDDTGTTLATSYRDIDGFNMVVDGGTYYVSLTANQLTPDVKAAISTTPSDSFALLPQPQPQVVSNPATATVPCTATITTSSVNLRSGPGTAYTVIDFGFLGDTYQVGGINSTNDWLVIGTSTGSAWVSRALTQLNGDCGNLTVYNVPVQNAQNQSLQVPANTNNGSNVIILQPPSNSFGDSGGDGHGESGDD